MMNDKAVAGIVITSYHLNNMFSNNFIFSTKLALKFLIYFVDFSELIFEKRYD